MVTAIRIPAPPAGHGYAYEKLKRKVGDYATAAAAVDPDHERQGSVATCSIGLTNVAETPLWAEEAAKIVVGSALDAATVKKAAAAAEAIASPASDNRGPAAYRKKMAGVMMARALQRAKSRAAEIREAQQWPKSHVTMKVNGKAVEALVEPRTLLIHFLREQLNLTGPHIGCDTSHCGACTVDLNGKSVKSCTMFAVQADGGDVLTIEGMAARRRHAARAAGRLPRDARAAMRLLYARHDRARATAC